jgi:hypothetical protein
MLLFKVNLRINLLSKITHLTAIKNLKHTSRSLHLNADNEICKPQEFNTCIFGQHDPGKTPIGKTSEEEFIMEFDKKLLQQRIQEIYSQTYLKEYLPSSAMGYLPYSSQTRKKELFLISEPRPFLTLGHSSYTN